MEKEGEGESGREGGNGDEGREKRKVGEESVKGEPCHMGHSWERCRLVVGLYAAWSINFTCRDQCYSTAKQVISLLGFTM